MGDTGAGAVASTILSLFSDPTIIQNWTKVMAAVGGSIGISFAFFVVFGLILTHRVSLHCSVILRLWHWLELRFG